MSATTDGKKRDKGKQKVADIDVDVDEPQQDDDNRDVVTFVIKFSEDSIPDLTFSMDDIHSATVTTIKSTIRNKVGGMTTNRRLRLIHAGKVLNMQTDIAKDVARIDKPSHNPASKIYIHCSVGDILTARELAQESELDTRIPTRTTLPELRGFDRLRATGFSEEDISQLRQQFDSIYGYQNSGASRDTITDLEEQWIDNGVTDPETANALGGDYLDDLIGILIGMFLGVFALFFLKLSQVFSPRQEKAMLAGVLLNFAFAVLRGLM